MAFVYFNFANSDARFNFLYEVPSQVNDDEAPPENIQNNNAQVAGDGQNEHQNQQHGKDIHYLKPQYKPLSFSYQSK